MLIILGVPTSRIFVVDQKYDTLHIDTVTF